jgi:hypothetical protein
MGGARTRDRRERLTLWLAGSGLPSPGACSLGHLHGPILRIGHADALLLVDA